MLIEGAKRLTWGAIPRAPAIGPTGGPPPRVLGVLAPLFPAAGIAGEACCSAERAG